jgi:hypothetical protein
MIEKIKAYASYLYGLVILILGALYFGQKRKTESAESELASEKAQGAIRENEQDRQAAREHANDLVNEYERLKNEKDL